jgi:proton-dependent oligopeptide transporter, POT family
MSTSANTGKELPKSHDTSFFGHPRGLATLFFTEMWERFSYYGMRAILVLYMVAPVASGGLGFDTVRAATVYGLYTGSVYALSIPGGWLADQVLGARLTVVLGGLGIAAGNGMIALGSAATLYGGLAMIVLGTGLLKPNVSVMVGGLYEEQDIRRDAGFSIFYMGINVGAILAPLLCGYLAQRINWHLGFVAACGVMLLGLVQFIGFRGTLGHIGEAPAHRGRHSTHEPHPPLTREEWRRIGAIAVLFVFSAVFWMSFEQAGSSLNLFADQLTRDRLFGIGFPSSWFQAVEPIFVVLMAPVFSWVWIRMADHQPSSPAKFSYALFAAVVAFGLMIYAAMLTTGGRVSPMWLIVVYFFQAIGELLLSPVGLSTTTKLAPPRMVGLMMGVWFLSIAAGNYLAGFAASFYRPDEHHLVVAFGAVALLTLVGGFVLAALTPFMRRLMGTVR